MNTLALVLVLFNIILFVIFVVDTIDTAIKEEDGIFPLALVYLIILLVSCILSINYCSGF